MLRVGICDEAEEYRKMTADILFRTMFDVEDVCFTFYESGKDLALDIISGKFQIDLLIMDPIFRWGVNGLKILEYIREQKLKTEIILQTNATELALKGYELHIFDFILKPVSIQGIERVARRFIREKLLPSDGFLTISIQGNQQRLRLGQVLFFESHGRKITAVLLGDEVEFYMRLDELWENINDKGFIRCHQSFIVNKNYITGMISGELQLFNKKTIPISRKYAQQVRQAVIEKIED